MARAAATYDLSTDVGKVRALIADTDTVNHRFSDAEISAFLVLAPAGLFSAAALAAETWARAQGNLSAMIRSSDGTVTQRRTTADLLALAKSLRESALNGTLQTGSLLSTSPGEMLDSYRPEWRGIDDVAVVE